MLPQADHRTVAVIGAGIIGCATASALARDGRRVLLIDRAEPGLGGASFGNVGHVAAEMLEPLPSISLLFNFWSLLYAFGGPLHIPARRLPHFAPWAARFARAALHRNRNTRSLAPLVRCASEDFAQALTGIGRLDLLRQHGHYEVWLGAGCEKRAAAAARHMQRIGVATQTAAPDILRSIARPTAQSISGLWFPGGSHIVDPAEVCRAFAHAAIERGGSFWRTDITAITPGESTVAVHGSEGAVQVGTVVVSAGVWSSALLEPFGLRVPLASARGYHVELPGHAAHVDAPLSYVDQKLLVTPMAGRLRSSSFMEFVDPSDPADERKPAWLRAQLRKLGYECELQGPSWVGARPVLPDYLPGIGRVPGSSRVFYGVGHQHIGLTLGPITAELIAALVADRQPRHDTAPFDLRRFG